MRPVADSVHGGKRNGASGAGALSHDEASSISIKDVSKVFRAADGSAVIALDNVSLSVTPGEMVSLVGQSGCGKSTILRLIAGLDQPTAGEVREGTEIITGTSAERGMMFQNANLFPWLTVRRNIESGLVARGILRQRRHEVDEFMRLVGLEAFANVYPHELSGGMAQRVALARALVNHPKVLLLDEPLGALDQFTRMRMQDEIIALWQARGTTMVLVTHYVDEAIYMSDRIVVMTPRPGRIERVLENPLPRPRDRNSPEFQQLRAEILQILHLAGNEGGQDKISAISLRPAQPGGPSGQSSPNAKSQSLQAPTGVATSLDAQVIIIGAGPAGSALGAYLAKAGVDHLILDKAVHPRRHVGESLVCSTTPVFQELDFLDVMEHEGFVHKHGASWTHWAEPRQYDLRFREIPELGISQDYTYHVDRARFDQLLLEHAEQTGSRVLQGAHVERVEFGSDGAACGVTIQQSGRQRSLRCKLIVDASGRSTVLGTQLKLKRRDPLFHQFAVHNWFEEVDRGPAATSDFIHIHVLPAQRGWAWQIPISSTVTSMGVVTDKTAFVKAGEPVEEFFKRQVGTNPVLAERMARARPIQEYYREGNYSYVLDRFAGDGWVAVGDAARFVDPVFSSGLSVALESARQASRVIVSALKGGDVGASQFADYESRLRRGVDIWREFILLYYRLPPLFLDLITRPDARYQLLRLLQGEVYDRGSVPVLEQMQQSITAVESDPAHPWHSYLNCHVAAEG
jgi:ABC-type nitrate/sulfonate/bicarbonate transport system ATPase subunit/flavin-dependent dehydrogenase